jgi:hypothetical protein
MRSGGLALCTLVLVVYAGSWKRSHYLSYASAGNECFEAQLWRGRTAVFWWGNPERISGIGVAPHPLRYGTAPKEFDSTEFSLTKALLSSSYAPGAMTALDRGRTRIDVRFPVWPAFCLGALLALAGWRTKSRRFRVGCPSCNYDLSGLPPGAPCPECAAVHSRACHAPNSERE